MSLKQLEEFNLLKKKVDDLRVKEGVLLSKIDDQKRLSERLLEEGRTRFSLSSNDLQDMIAEATQIVTVKLEELRLKVEVCESFYSRIQR